MSGVDVISMKCRSPFLPHCRPIANSKKCSRRVPLPRHQLDNLPRKFHLLPRPQLGPLAGVDLAVDADEAFADGCMGVSARVGEASGFEQLIELDVVAADGETDGHGKPFSDCGVGIITHADAVISGLPTETP